MLMLENVSVIQGLIATKGLKAKGFFWEIFKKMTKQVTTNDKTTKRQRRQTTKQQIDKTTK